MTKLLLTLGLLASFAVPATAGRLDVDPPMLANPSQLNHNPAEASVSVTRQIEASDRQNTREENNDPFNHGDLFGANSR